MRCEEGECCYAQGHRSLNVLALRVVMVKVRKRLLVHYNQKGVISPVLTGVLSCHVGVPS